MFTRFELVRSEDVSGCSGIGIVAIGVLFPQGKAVLMWMPGHAGVSSTGFYDSIAELLAVHGHEGRTKIRYLDLDSPPANAAKIPIDMLTGTVPA